MRFAFVPDVRQCLFADVDTMEEIKTNAILQFNENQLQNVRRALGYDDVNKLKQDIELLKDWISKQNHFKVKEFDQNYLERLLIYNKGSIERTKQRMDKLCTCTNLMPEFLKNFDIKNEFHPLFNIFNQCVLPKPTEDNYRIIVSRFNGVDDNDYSVIQMYRYLMLFGHYMLNNDYCHGYVWIFECRDVTVGNLARSNPLIIHKGLTLFTEAMGQRLKSFHLINDSKMFDALMIIAKQVLSAKLKKRLVVHKSLESLYEVFPKEILPKELGGNEKSMKEMNDMMFKEFSSEKNIETMKFMEEVATDESCRLSCTFNEEYSGMPGSFKTLCVD